VRGSSGDALQPDIAGYLPTLLFNSVARGVTAATKVNVIVTSASCGSIHLCYNNQTRNAGHSPAVPDGALLAPPWAYSAPFLHRIRYFPPMIGKAPSLCSYFCFHAGLTCWLSAGETNSSSALWAVPPLE
jgi:hypothetical protein